MDWVKLCNCAGEGCGVELLGESMRRLTAVELRASGYAGTPFVRGRIAGRPYCPACLESRLGQTLAGTLGEVGHAEGTES
jgi:hypothetical protein